MLRKRLADWQIGSRIAMFCQLEYSAASKLTLGSVSVVPASLNVGLDYTTASGWGPACGRSRFEAIMTARVGVFDWSCPPRSSPHFPLLPLLDNYLARDGEKRLLSNSGGQ